MKKFILIVLTVFISSLVTAQNPNLFTSKYLPGIVLLNSGTEMDGFIALKENSDIKFKKSLDSKNSIIYNKENIISLTFEDAIFHYKTVVNKSSEEIKALQLETDGEVSLYSDSFIRYINTGIAGSGSGINAAVQGQEVHYYIGRKHEVDVIFLRYSNSYSNKFKKIAEMYFGSCPKLIEKISNREFERFDITGIVDYYNNDCI